MSFEVAMDRLPEEANATGQRIPFKALKTRDAITAAEYSTDPNVITPKVTWDLLLSRRQLNMVAALSDIILPGTSEFAAPSKMGISNFFNEWLSAPYKTQQSDKDLILQGMGLLDRESRRRYWLGFLWLSSKRKAKVLDAVIAMGGDPRKFFTRFRYLLVGGYFTSDMGFPAIGYRGNVPLQSFAPVPADIQRIIDDELRQLGL
ncbi:gluconate 2-dehydrogenase subunit 3 family protein [Bradyrhizobium sp. 41S5]|uniref:gluconate 2-dehydrogenase subunit 3 family protein n=1 Tax=Bradyrhizobium sp. 41S5 TaxID=1404443 RepID=UPI00156B2E14|nr:gluconate 2-dehydrogenase subunit 3 family protein [Bradyrhizobium sp. 41S5]UFX46500.1 gluconate 2-dehydrogenase subunit 3 family protein [Bradyrhizobium sp. 41S5]